MNTFTEVNKNIGENVENVVSMRVNFKPGRTTDMFQTARAQFVEALRKDGYTVNMHNKGNFIEANKNGEKNVFYFTAHSANRSNYLIPVELKYVTNYFAFYDNSRKCVNMVSYGKVRAYCKDITKAVSFNGSEPKMFVPDSWATEQKINTYNL